MNKIKLISIALVVLVSLCALPLELAKPADAQAWSIELITPNGGETLEGNTICYINYTSSQEGGYMFLHYSTDGGATYPHLIESCIPNDWGGPTTPGYAWTVPDIDCSTVRVKVSWMSGCGFPSFFWASDESDSNFTIGTPETVSTPTTPWGDSSGEVGQTLTFYTGGASSNLGHNIEYRFYIFVSGDVPWPIPPGWSSSTSVSHSWSSPGTYCIHVRARCATHTSVLSDMSPCHTVTIYEPEETVSTPDTPTGPSTGEIGQSLTFSTGGASSSMGHSLHYRFDWGDGTYSSWSSSTSASHSWSSAGTRTVRAQARCATHTSVTSSWSGEHPVSFDVETVSTPDTPTGPSTGEIGQSLTFSTGGASSSMGHSIQYRFDWDDGSISGWTSSTSYAHSWSSAGTYYVRAQARCATHTSVTSSWSAGHPVSFDVETVSAPTPTPTPTHTTISTEMVLIADDAIVPPGDMVWVPIRLENAENLKSLDFNLLYDPVVAEATDVVSGSLLAPFTLVPDLGEPGIIRFSFTSEDACSGSGWAAVVEFEAAGSLGDHSYLTLSDVLPADANAESLSISLDDGELTIGEREEGDANCDGVIDEADALNALLMYVQLVPEDLNVDMNGDGSVTPDDARMIMQQAAQRSA
jgi:hypothetical protein